MTKMTSTSRWRKSDGLPASVVERTGEAEDEEEEEEPEDEDVEASLDVILKERLVVEDEPEDDEATDQEDRTEGNERVLPKQPDEFVLPFVLPGQAPESAGR